MARAVGVTADDLVAAGRSDAADLLQAAEQDRTLRQRLAAIPGIGAIGASALADTARQELLPLISASFDLIDSSDLQPATKRELTTVFTEGLIHDAAQRHRELVLMLKLTSITRQSG